MGNTQISQNIVGGEEDGYIICVEKELEIELGEWLSAGNTVPPFPCCPPPSFSQVLLLEPVS